MNPFATTLALLLKSWCRSLLGPGVDQAVLGSITWADMCVSVIFLALAALASGMASAIVRRRTAAPAGAAGPVTQHNIFRALGKPLHLLIWACGLYLAAAPLILAAGPSRSMRAVGSFLGAALDLAVFAVVFWFVFRITDVLEARLALWAARTSSKLDNLLAPLLGRSLRIAVPVVGVILALPLLHLPPRFDTVLAKGTSILLIVGVAAILFDAVRVAERGLLARFDIEAADNLRARKIHTQVHVITKVIDVVIAVFTIASVLMLFEEVRRLGASLLASAGIVGIIAGIAAQKTIANLLAGFQIALAQPMREDDVVIVEGEWGRVEEITLTYVVVHIWDDRRLVLPLSYFIEKPFQNWTRTSSSLLGSVHVWVDYSFPVEEGRAALKEIIEPNPLWDRRFWNLQVSDATERTMQLRVLATAKDSSAAWNLRCDIREKFIAYIRSRHPASLPQVRASLTAEAIAGAVATS